MSIEAIDNLSPVPPGEILQEELEALPMSARGKLGDALDGIGPLSPPRVA